ncbi:DrmB family protein [Actinomadura opuntiae]|uniref:DrmB family protein n=1 Tax=Actinomadura sp. OS1-43 TaxID=604315 RepID=UPI00255AA6C8|nr:DrmB family protein [Actinomadura sp. OS1-43]MDL4816940.1 DrmB family protein [Actinomadura sp. OS1-43]
MTSGNIRRAQLISPFGAGAMTVLVDGTSVIAAGLDHWFEGATDPEEFSLEEWRLQSRLKVNHFRLPPPYVRPSRRAAGPAQRTTNLDITVPFLRFPAWSFCPFCKRLEASPLVLEGKAYCKDPAHERGGKRGKGPAMAQVPFVTVCEQGHLDDFPWREWVHRSVQPSCVGTLRLHSRGGGSLAGQEVSCDGCKRKRSLENVMNTIQVDGQETTILSSTLEKGADFSCRGFRPWLGGARQPCGWPIRGSLRGASNVYFPLVESSIYLPQSPSSTPEELMEIVTSEQFASGMSLARAMGDGKITVENFRKMDRGGLTSSFSDDQVRDALDEYLGGEAGEQDYDLDEHSPTEWRRPEHAVLRESIEHPHLRVTRAKGSYASAVDESFSRVRLIETLRETRALWGFTRLKSGGLKLREGKKLLRLTPLPPGLDWLPAYTVNGEGIYLELDETRLQGWESRREVQQRAGRLAARYETVRASRGSAEREVSPRLVLVHTITHLLINQLIFDCGYSTASLRERLFVSTNRQRPMAGMLIYTAAGDAEGTMGGLVRMGKPGYLERVWEAGLANAAWCSTDPICMEEGESGQGPDSCNLAACHSCGLLPETSCEEFNRFLDRGLVVGSLKEPEIGFFQPG